MTPDRTDANHDESAEHGVLDDGGNLDTASITILGGHIAQVSVDLPMAADDDDLDDDVIEDEIPVGDVDLPALITSHDVYEPHDDETDHREVEQLDTGDIILEPHDGEESSSTEGDADTVTHDDVHEAELVDEPEHEGFSHDARADDLHDAEVVDDVELFEADAAEPADEALTHAPWIPEQSDETDAASDETIAGDDAGHEGVEGDVDHAAPHDDAEGESFVAEEDVAAEAAEPSDETAVEEDDADAGDAEEPVTADAEAEASSPEDELEAGDFHEVEGDFTASAESSSDEPAAEESITDDTFVGDTFVGDMLVEEPVADEQAADEPIADEPAVEDVIVNEASSDEPALDEPAVEEPAGDEPAVEEPAVETPAVDGPAVVEPNVDEPVGAEPAVEEPADAGSSDAELPAAASPAAPAAPSASDEATAPATGPVAPPSVAASVVAASVAAAAGPRADASTGPVSTGTVPTGSVPTAPASTGPVTTRRERAATGVIGTVPLTRRSAQQADDPTRGSDEAARVDRAHAMERVRTQTPEVTLTSKRIGQIDDARESSDLLTADRLLDPRQIARPEPEGAWQQLVYSATGGRVNLGDGRRARQRKDLDRRISTPLTGGARFVPVLSRKGGVGKTTVTSLLGMALADARDDRIIAVDANPDRGTLADRVGRPNGRTVRDLVRAHDEMVGFNDVSAIVARDATRLDVLASDADPRVSEAFSDDDYRQVADVAAHYYSIVLTDTGTGIVHSVMGATLELADTLVIVAGLSVDEARLASETLTWLETNGYAARVRDAIVVLNNSRPGTPLVRESELEAHFRSRVRTVIRMPYDARIAAGSAIAFRDLQPSTRQAARELAAAVVEGLRAPVSAA